MKYLIILSLCLSQGVAFGQDTINATQAQQYVGKKVILCDRVNGGNQLSVNTNTPIILYVGPDYPNHHVAVYFPQHVVKRFSFDPQKKMLNKRFCVTGKLGSYERKPAIYVRRESQVNEEEVNSFIYDFDKKKQ